MSNNTYIALTIGPIYRTLNVVKTTKGIWAASYLFSYIVKQIIDAVKNEADFIIPFADPEELKTGQQTKAGLFPDRFICVNKEGLLGKMKDAKETIIQKLAQEITEDLKKQHDYGDNNPTLKGEHKKFLTNNSTAVQSYLKAFFFIYMEEISVPPKENVIFYINSHLDAAEMQQPFVQEEAHDHLTRFFENVYYNFLVRKEFGNRDEQGIKFPSSAEIATIGAKYEAMPNCSAQQHQATCFKWFAHKQDGQENSKLKDPKLAQTHFYEDMKDFYLFQHHKYIAVVEADGDNIGKLIQAINDKNADNLIEERFTDFSRQLFTFAYQSTKLIQDYGGVPVYAGGDDLLFFAPIVNQTTKESIFKLIDDIDNLFKEKILENAKLKPLLDKINPKPSMSYGVSITYYKHPLNEARQIAHEQLISHAKKGNKNAIAIHLQKHSGQSFAIRFDKSHEKTQKAFGKLLQNAHTTDEKMLTSVMHKLYPLEGVLKEIGTNEMLLKNFFDNNFNESVHKKEHNKTFLKNVRCFIHAMFCDMASIDEKEQETLSHVYGALRFIHFIQMPYSSISSSKNLTTQ